MEDVARMTQLLDELETFIRYETQAINEANWDYFRELAAKKDGHVKKVAQLAVNVDLEQNGLRGRIEAVIASQEKTAKLLAEYMTANQNNANQLEQAKNKLAKARAYVDKQLKVKAKAKANKVKRLDTNA